ncbi:MAG TPA: homoserine kinase [Actinomycetota bacterium]|nr:homoserine kinase [Actinomycetota bacterium]
MSVTVRVPATIANLGPGFDCLGLAIAWHNRVTLAPAGTTTIAVTGPGEDRIPRNDNNLVLRSVRAWEAAVGAAPGEWAIDIDNDAPYGRGFGSSAAAIVGGLVAARAAIGGDANVLALAGEIEGHLDNVSAALLGGITVSGYAPGDAIRIEPPSRIVPLVCVAAGRLSTKEARASLPAQVPFGDAVANASRAALLVAVLTADDPARLLAATEERLHQPPRFRIAPETGALVAALRSEGIAAFLSGAGPSVAALVAADEAGDIRALAERAAPEGWDVRIVPFEANGAAEAAP